MQYPNTKCHDRRDYLAKFTDDRIKRMLVPNWASVAPGDDVLDAGFKHMEAILCARVWLCVRERA